MIVPGLCSVSFREKTAEEIIAQCAEWGVPAIEWGGDRHVPHGDYKTAGEIRKRCEQKGIDCPSYGSYYRAGNSEEEGLQWEAVLHTAESLGCQTVRIWGGTRAPAEAEDSYYILVAEDIRRGASLAQERGISLSLEYHENTLTENPASLRKLDELIAHPNVRYYWQPPHGYTDKQCMESLKALEGKLSNLHVFHWLRADACVGREFDRYPLADGAPRWQRFFQTISGMPREGSTSSGKAPRRFAFLEFVRGDSFRQFGEDWKTLNSLLKAIS